MIIGCPYCHVQIACKTLHVTLHTKLCMNVGTHSQRLPDDNGPVDSKSEPENAGKTYASLFAHITAEQGGRNTGR